MNVVYDHCIVLRHSGSADSLAHGNTHMFGWRSVKPSQDKRVRIDRIEHIKARPVVVGQALRNDLHYEALQRRKIVCGLRKCAYLGKNLSEGILGHPLILQERPYPCQFPTDHIFQIGGGSPAFTGGKSALALYERVSTLIMRFSAGND
jgi:hypothetical protein